MKIICISDSHSQHQDLILPSGDILLHAGDISTKGKEHEVDAFLQWFTVQPHQYKIFIAGNHDFYFETTLSKTIEDKIPENIIYLNDSGCTIAGLHIWGSPVQPTFFDWAFNRDRGEDIQKHWNLIPHNTDILITHGPPYGILDKTIRNQHVGCEALINTVRDVVPKLHVFGHIHEDYGKITEGQTTFINASVLDHKYRLINAPVVFHI